MLIFAKMFTNVAKVMLNFDEFFSDFRRVQKPDAHAAAPSKTRRPRCRAVPQGGSLLDFSNSAGFPCCAFSCTRLSQLRRAAVNAITAAMPREVCPAAQRFQRARKRGRLEREKAVQLPASLSTRPRPSGASSTSSFF